MSDEKKSTTVEKSETTTKMNEGLFGDTPARDDAGELVKETKTTSETTEESE
jgi:hypothetical protein